MKEHAERLERLLALLPEDGRRVPVGRLVEQVRAGACGELGERRTAEIGGLLGELCAGRKIALETRGGHRFARRILEAEANDFPLRPRPTFGAPPPRPRPRPASWAPNVAVMCRTLEEVERRLRAAMLTPMSAEVLDAYRGILERVGKALAFARGGHLRDLEHNIARAHEARVQRDYEERFAAAASRQAQQLGEMVERVRKDLAAAEALAAADERAAAERARAARAAPKRRRAA